jgi:hypothetical protein
MDRLGTGYDRRGLTSIPSILKRFYPLPREKSGVAFAVEGRLDALRQSSKSAIVLVVPIVACISDSCVCRAMTESADEVK